MSKGVKKGLTIIGFILVIVLALMISIPFLFKDKIKDAVVGIANDNLNAKIEIGDFGLNLFTNFPNATLALNDVNIVGVDDFAADTLVQAKLASVTIDLSSLFGDNYKISKINLDEAEVYAKVLKGGKANWDIVKSDSTDIAVDEDESSAAFNLALKDIRLKACNVIYEDQESNLKAMIQGLHGNINGDFAASETTLNTHAEIDALTVIMDGVPFLSKAKGIADAKINANLDNMKFKFTESKVNLNDLIAVIDGSFGFVGEEGMEFDLKLKAPDVDFKQILSLVPAMYTDDFKNVKTAGKASLDAYVMGVMEGEHYPAFDLRITIADAMFQYPSLPKSVNNINLMLTVNGEGGSIDNTVIMVDKFGFTLGGNPFKGGLRVTPPLSNATVKFFADGKLDLGMIKDVYPLEKGTELNGQITANMKVSTTMSAIEKEQYESISAEGHLQLNNMVYKSEGMDDVLINNAAMELTPKYINLSALDVKIGDSDVQATGRLENFIAFALKNQTLKGQLNVKSALLDLDKLMGEDTAVVEEEVDERSEDIIIPKNIDFVLSANFNKVIFSKINVTNISGGIGVKNGVLSLNKIAANALGGLCNISGAYNTAEPKDPKVNFDLGLTRVSFKETFRAVDAVKKFAPIFEDLEGAYSMSMKFDTKLRPTSSETMKSLNANGSLMTNDVKIENNKALSALGKALKTDKLNNIAPKDLNLPFTIKDGALTTKPFSVKFGDGGVIDLEGATNLDQTIDYKGAVKLPKSLDNKIISSVPITIGGTFTSPKIGVDVKSAVTDVVGNTIGKLLGGKGGDDSATSAEAKAKQIEKLRTQADQTADKLVEEAKKQSANLEKEAGSNKLAKAAAKAAGKRLVKEAEKQAQKLRDSAEEQIKKLEGDKAVSDTTSVTTSAA